MAANDSVGAVAGNENPEVGRPDARPAEDGGNVREEGLASPRPVDGRESQPASKEVSEASERPLASEPVRSRSAAAEAPAEVEMYDGTLLSAIREGVVEAPPLCEFNRRDEEDPESVSWLNWRRDEGMRPRVSGDTAKRWRQREAALWKSCMRECHGRTWRHDLEARRQVKDDDAGEESLDGSEDSVAGWSRRQPQGSPGGDPHRGIPG